MARSQKKPAAAGSSKMSLRTRTTTIPGLFQKQKTASKRKMQEQEETSSDEDDEIESSQESSDSESDVERTTKRRTRRTRRGRITVDTSSQLLEPIVDSQTGQDNLYDEINKSDCNHEKLVANWRESYEADKMAALRELVNFVIRCSGCSIGVSEVAFNQEDGSLDALKELQDQLTKLPSHDYPVISKSKEDKILRRNLLLFFGELIERTRYEEIYDGVMIETLHNWLTTISSSTYRPFRHTATLVAFRIITSLCTLGKDMKEEHDVVLRQFNAEKKKGSNSRNVQKSKLLGQRFTTVDNNLKTIQEYLNDYFNSIFVHRSRDVESVIRTECIKELCQWMCVFEFHFVDNTYLRFLGWAFNDQSANVRSEAVKSMISLYRIEDIATKLSAFTNRFKSRIEEMALYDIDVSVRVHAIHLCHALLKSNIDVLSEDGQLRLASTIASDVPRIRKAVAPFVKAMIEKNFITPLTNEITGATSSTRGRGRKTTNATTSSANVNQDWIIFKSIASFLVQQSVRILEQETNNGNGTDGMQVDLSSLTNTLVERRNIIITNAVEALWNQYSKLQDCQAISDYLSRDHSRVSEQSGDQMDTGELEDYYRLSEDEEVVLVNVFVACISTAVEKGLDKNLTEVKDKRHIDKSILDENKKEISRYLAQALPKLLTKHADDANKMTQLVLVPTFMDLNAYVELRAEKEYEELMQTLIKVYQNAVLKDLVANCAESLQHMSKADYLSEINMPQLSTLREAVVNQVREACNGKDLVTTRYNTALIHSISVSMLRLSYLISFTDPTTAMDDAQGMSMNVVDYIGALVDRAAFGYEKEKNIAQSAMVVLSRYIMWKCNSLAYSSEAAGLIERRRDWILDKFTEVVVGTDISPLPEVRASAFGYLIDIYWLFGSDLFDSYDLARLKTRCSANLQRACAEYVKEQMDSLNKPAEEANQLTDTERAAQKEIVLQVVTSYSRGILMGVLDISYTVSLLELYGSNPEIDDVIKALVTEFETDVLSGEIAADGICRSYMGALKQSFNKNISDSWRSIDKTLKLARLEASSLKRADQADAARKVPPHVVCERIHLDGISFALAKAREAYENNQDNDRDNALRFFKVLTVFAKDLARARDIARIRNHLEDSLKNNKLSAEEGKKEWEHYDNYIKSLDDVLKKKGLRYDSTKRANNAETPAAPIFDDTMEDLDEGELEGNDYNSKRPLHETEMELDDAATTKRRRNL